MAPSFFGLPLVPPDPPDGLGFGFGFAVGFGFGISPSPTVVPKPSVSPSLGEAACPLKPEGVRLGGADFAGTAFAFAFPFGDAVGC